MTKAQADRNLREESLETLRKMFPITPDGRRPTTIYTITRHVSRSGNASVSVIDNGVDGPSDVSYHVARALGFKMDPDHGGVKVGYMGEKRDAALVHDLARALWGSSTALNHVEL